MNLKKTIRIVRESNFERKIIITTGCKLRKAVKARRENRHRYMSANRLYGVKPIHATLVCQLVAMSVGSLFADYPYAVVYSFTGSPQSTHWH